MPLYPAFYAANQKGKCTKGVAVVADNKPETFIRRFTATPHPPLAMGRTNKKPIASLP
jgi:hypothetical protein